jgi:DNA-directed RNA polymerase beta' subunit
MCPLPRYVNHYLFLKITRFYYYSANYGFSLGIDDVIPGRQLSKKKGELVEQAYAECQDLIADSKKGKLKNKPGCDQDQTLEALISSVLSAVRGVVGQICMQELSRQNAPLIMATCGSKGIRDVFMRQMIFNLDCCTMQVPLSTFLRWWLV